MYIFSYYPTSTLSSTCFDTLSFTSSFLSYPQPFIVNAFSTPTSTPPLTGSTPPATIHSSTPFLSSSPLFFYSLFTLSLSLYSFPLSVTLFFSLALQPKPSFYYFANSFPSFSHRVRVSVICLEFSVCLCMCVCMCVDLCPIAHFYSERIIKII